jgi:hypothetical protein
MVVLSGASEVAICQRWRDQLGEVGHPVERCVEERGHQQDLAGPNARRADLVAHLSEHSCLWQGRQRFPIEP